MMNAKRMCQNSSCNNQIPQWSLDNAKFCCSRCCQEHHADMARKRRDDGKRAIEELQFANEELSKLYSHIDAVHQMLIAGNFPAAQNLAKQWISDEAPFNVDETDPDQPTAQIVANTCSCQGKTILYGSWRCQACGQERRPS
ncbi:hypothetical protein [Shewanella algae]|uniref:hypothetical protein n=1 Tax=Shewanella algae TaxID=38313 RepID=UPI0031F50C20